MRAAIYARLSKNDGLSVPTQMASRGSTPKIAAGRSWVSSRTSASQPSRKVRAQGI